VNDAFVQVVFLVVDQILKLPGLTNCNSSFLKPLRVLLRAQLFSVSAAPHGLHNKGFIRNALPHLFQLHYHLLILGLSFSLECSISGFESLFLIFILKLLGVLDNLKVLSKINPDEVYLIHCF
jgi:hypothetical protein